MAKKISDHWKKLNRLYWEASGLYHDLPFSDDCDGLRQFIDFDSNGIIPETPDRYFLHLKCGKERWNWMRTELELNFRGKGECGTELMRWPGLYQLWHDYKGQREWLRDLISWYPAKLPDSFFAEGDVYPFNEVHEAMFARIQVVRKRPEVGLSISL